MKKDVGLLVALLNDCLSIIYKPIIEELLRRTEASGKQLIVCPDGPHQMQVVGPAGQLRRVAARIGGELIYLIGSKK